MQKSSSLDESLLLMLLMMIAIFIVDVVIPVSIVIAVIAKRGADPYCWCCRSVAIACVVIIGVDVKGKYGVCFTERKYIWNQCLWT